MFQNNETNLRQISRPTPPLGPLHMSPVNQDGPVTGMNFALGSYEKFQPGLRDENRSKILGTSSGAKFGKQRKHGETQKILTFGPILPSVTLKAVSLQLNGMLMMWKIQEAMQDEAIWTARIHLAVHPGNRNEVFIWQNFHPAYRDVGWKNQDLGNRTSRPSHMNTLKKLQRI